MSQFLAPINYDRARETLRRLSFYTQYTPEGAARALQVLEEAYPAIFEGMERKTFPRGAVLLEKGGAGLTGPLVFAAHVDADGGELSADCPHELPMRVPLSRAHLVTLLEALDALLKEGYRPGGDLMLALSMDGLSGGAGAKSMAEHLRARSVSPCLILDYGGYATMEAFRTYLPKGAPLALVGVAEKGELHGVLTARGGERPADALLRAGKRLTRHPFHASLCNASVMMLKALGKHAPLLQRWLVRSPRLTFPLMRVMWRKRAVMRQFFFSERTVYDLSAHGTPQNPAQAAQLSFTQTLIPGQKTADYRRHLKAVAGDPRLSLDFPVENEPGARSECEGDAWDALCTAIEIQMDRVVIVPCLAPFPTDARFYAGLGGCAYRFSPFLVTGEEALRAQCTVTDGALQTAVQFFRSMLSV